MALGGWASAEASTHTNNHASHVAGLPTGYSAKHAALLYSHIPYSWHCHCDSTKPCVQALQQWTYGPINHKHLGSWMCVDKGQPCMMQTKILAVSHHICKLRSPIPSVLTVTPEEMQAWSASLRLRAVALAVSRHLCLVVARPALKFAVIVGTDRQWICKPRRKLWCHACTICLGDLNICLMQHSAMLSSEQTWRVNADKFEELGLSSWHLACNTVSSIWVQNIVIRWLKQQVTYAFNKYSQKQLLSHARCPRPDLTECLYTSASKPSMPLQPAHPCRLRKTFVGEHHRHLVTGQWATWWYSLYLTMCWCTMFANVCSQGHLSASWRGMPLCILSAKS